MSINRITQTDVAKFLSAVRADTDPLNRGSGEHSPDNALNLYQRISTKSAIYPGMGSPIGLMYVAGKGASEAGEFADHVGKAWRDDGLVKIIRNPGAPILEEGKLTPERHAALVKEIGDELWYLAAKCNELGITLSEAAAVNLEKLCARTDAGTLQGSGDGVTDRKMLTTENYALVQKLLTAISRMLSAYEQRLPTTVNYLKTCNHFRNKVAVPAGQFATMIGFLDEFSTAVDNSAEDIGGSRSGVKIMADLRAAYNSVIESGR